MKVARLLVLAFLVFMPWTWVLLRGLDINGHDYSRVVELALMFICAAWLAVQRTPMPCLPESRWGRYAAAAMLCLAGLSIFHAALPLWAVRELALWLGMLTLACTIAAHRQSPSLQVEITAAVVAGILSGGLELLLAMQAIAQQEPLRPSEFGLGYNYVRFLNHVQTASLPFAAFALALPSSSKLLRAGALFSLASGVSILIFTGGRGTLLGIAAAGVVSWLLLGRRAFSLLRALGIGLAAGAILYVVVFRLAAPPMDPNDGFNLTKRLTDAGSANTRQYLWHTAISYIKESPLLGIGPMHFSHRPNDDTAHPHNIYLQIAAEWGLPMLLLLLSTVIWLLRRLRAVAMLDSGEVGRYAAGLFFIWIAILGDGFVSGNFVMPTSQVWIAFIMGCSLVVIRTTPAQTTRNIGLPRLMFGLILGLQMFACVLASKDLRHIDAWLEQSRTLEPLGVSNPRFWSSGWF